MRLAAILVLLAGIVIASAQAPQSPPAPPADLAFEANSLM